MAEVVSPFPAEGSRIAVAISFSSGLRLRPWATASFRDGLQTLAVVPVASTILAVVPLPATQPWIAIHKVLQVLALAVGNARIAASGATPTVAEVVEATVDAVTPVAKAAIQ